MASFGYELVADALVEAGVNRLFGLLGDSTIGMATVASRKGIPFTSSRHEGGAVSLAGGYAFATDSPAVTTVSTGPGLTNGITALRAAVDLRLPVVVVVATAPDDGRLNRQRLDHEGYVRLVGAGWHQVSSHSEIRSGVSRAIISAASEHRPQVIEVNYEMMHSVGEAERAPDSIDVAAPQPASEAELMAALALMETCSRPVILAGIGAVFADSGGDLSLLASKFGALLATTLRARGLFAGDEFDIGLAGGFASPLARSLIEESDLVISFGAALNHHTTDNGRLFEGVPVIQVDSDPEALGRWHKASVEVHGDSKLVANQMLALLDEHAVGGERYRTQTVRDRIARFDLVSTVEDRGSAEGLDPRVVLLRLDEVLPRERMTITDTAHQIEWPSRYLRAAGRNSFMTCVGSGAIGNSLATSVGAALGSDRLTVCVLGDGALMMSLSELDTAVRAGVDLLVVVMNDSAFGAEVHKVRKLGLTEELAVFPPVDFSGVMKAIGGRSMMLRSPSDIDKVPDLLGDGPVLVDVPISRDIVGERLR